MLSPRPSRPDWGTQNIWERILFPASEIGCLGPGTFVITAVPRVPKTLRTRCSISVGAIPIAPSSPNATTASGERLMSSIRCFSS